MSKYMQLLAIASRMRMLAGRVGPNSRLEKSQRADFYRDLWCVAARQIGASVAVKGQVLIISRGEASAKVYRNYTDLDGPVTLRAAGNKPWVHEVVRGVGIPTPNYCVFSLNDLSRATAFLRQHGTCVVKPASGTGAGAGVTTGIKSDSQLFKAALFASAHCPELLIEQQIAGKNARLLFLDGCLLDAVERQPPIIVGNGKSSISQLIQNANDNRRKNGSQVAQVFLKKDLDMRQTLAAQGLGWQNVPANGRTVRLKTVINDNAAADNVSITEQLSDELIETCRRAVLAIGVRLAGVDIISVDFSDDLAKVNGVVLEINTVPGLYIHQNKQGVPVSVLILEACLQQVNRM